MRLIITDTEAKLNREVAEGFRLLARGVADNSTIVFRTTDSGEMVRYSQEFYFTEYTPKKDERPKRNRMWPGRRRA